MLAVSILSSASFAGTLAYWNFENGVAGEMVPHSTPGGIFDGTTPDVSGNGNALSVWDTSGAGMRYTTDVPVAGVIGTPNLLSVKNTGGGPAMFTVDRDNTPAGLALNTNAFPQFTVEASYKPETGGWRTIVGRDSRGVGIVNGDLSSFYLQATNDQRFAVKFTDVAGNFWEAQTEPNFVQGFDFPTDPNGLTGRWYNLVGVSDGLTLKLYVDNVLKATTDISSSANTALSVGVDPNPSDDWTSGGWSIGRGLYAGGHGDRAYGFIDEVRISDHALAPSEFLSAVPEPTSALAIAAMGLVARRRRA
jgi:hypothetical protein